MDVEKKYSKMMPTHSRHRNRKTPFLFILEINGPPIFPKKIENIQKCALYDNLRGNSKPIKTMAELRKEQK